MHLLNTTRTTDGTLDTPLPLSHTLLGTEDIASSLITGGETRCGSAFPLAASQFLLTTLSCNDGGNIPAL